MNLLIYVPPDGPPPLPAFLAAQDGKLRSKLESLLALLLCTPAGLLREPYVKHFSIEKYSALYELRAKGKALVRIIFTLQPNGDILLLVPFVKRHKRNTMQALDASLKMLAQIRDGTGSARELSIYIKKQEVAK